MCARLACDYYVPICDMCLINGICKMYFLREREREKEMLEAIIKRSPSITLFNLDQQMQIQSQLNNKVIYINIKELLT